MFKKIISSIFVVTMLISMNVTAFAATPKDMQQNVEEYSTVAPRAASTTITADNVKMRSGAGVGYSVVMTLNKGDYVVISYGDWVEADGYSWAPIEVGKTYGWVQSKYLGDF